MTSVLEALITYLKTIAALTTLVSTRIYGGELPISEVASMPRKLVIVRLAGGLEVFRSARLSRVRVDVLSHGEGYYEADQVDRAVCEALMAIQRTAASSTLLQSAGYGGAFQLKEPEHGWKYYARTALIVYDERTAA